MYGEEAGVNRLLALVKGEDVMTRYQDIQMEQELIFEDKLATFTEHDVHLHDALEISVLIENEAIYRLSKGDLVGAPGDVFLFRPFESHWTLVREQDRPARWIMILFMPGFVRHVPDGFKLLAPFYAMDGISPLLPASSPYAQRIRALARQGVEETRCRETGWKARHHAILIEVLVAINRWYRDAIANQQRETEPGVIRAVEYMLQHYGQDIASGELLEVSGMRKTWFYRKFHEVTALSPHDFITRLRLQHASYLLRIRVPIVPVAEDGGAIHRGERPQHLHARDGIASEKPRRQRQDSPWHL